jgi:hypothetical protein
MGKGLDMKFGVLAPTVPSQENGEPVDDQVDGETNGQSRGARTTRSRRGRRVSPGGKVSGRKFQLPDTVFERLQLHAIKKRSNPSAVLSDILDRELPKHKIATED